MVVGKDFTPAKISDVQIDSPADEADLRKMILLNRLMINNIKSVIEVPTYQYFIKSEKIEIVVF